MSGDETGVGEVDDSRAAKPARTVAHRRQLGLPSTPCHKPQLVRPTVSEEEAGADGTEWLPGQVEPRRCWRREVNQLISSACDGGQWSESEADTLDGGSDGSQQPRDETGKARNTYLSEWAPGNCNAARDWTDLSVERCARDEHRANE